MKKFKKFFAVILSLAMVLGMSLTALAADNIAADAKGSSSDRVNVKIENLTGTPTVTLYQIASGNYQGTGAGAFVDYAWATGIDESVSNNAKNGLSANEITAIVNGIKDGTVKATAVDTQKNVGATYTATVAAGAYIALITEATDDSVYNPILLTASYNADGQFVGGTISANDKYLYGTTAVAKKSTPDVNKTINENTSDGAKDEDIADEVAGEGGKWTASVGDKIDYDVALTIPSYPTNAVNKTLFVSDEMTEGLSYLPASLTIKVNNDTVKANANGEFVYKDETIATVYHTTDHNGFRLNFVYDKLISNASTGTTYAVTVSYSAMVNDKAVVAPEANKNTVKMYYANDPSQGHTFQPSTEQPEPQEGQGIKKVEDSKNVFTYQLAFKKTGEGEEAEALANAIFGIYTSKECKDTDLLDIVKTNEKGYAVSTSVGKGTYWVKEIQAPDGYSLNDKAYEVEAKWTTATTTITRKEETVKYTTEKDKAEQQPAVAVGWLLNGVFYAGAEETNKPDASAQLAYILERTETETTTTEAVTNPDAVGGTVLLSDNIPNTKLASLPSTGGIGTTIFTIGGCIIMVVAAALFFVSRRKSAK